MRVGSDRVVDVASAITKEEKQRIRARLLSGSIEETSSQLAVQNAVIVGKVARIEYPLEWPKVFTDITALIRPASDATASGTSDDRTTLQLTRALSMLLHVVKELATGRLSRTKTSLQSVTPEILRFWAMFTCAMSRCGRVQLTGRMRTPTRRE